MALASTVGVVVKRAKGSLAGAACPVPTKGLVDPNPIAQSVNVSPALAGWVATPGQDPSGMGRLPSRLVTMPYRPTPPSRMRGARGTISNDIGLLTCDRELASGVGVRLVVAHRPERGRRVLRCVRTVILARERDRQRDALAGAILRGVEAFTTQGVGDEVVVLASGRPAAPLGPLRAHGVADDLSRDQVPGCSAGRAGIEATR